MQDTQHTCSRLELPQPLTMIPHCAASPHTSMKIDAMPAGGALRAWVGRPPPGRQGNSQTHKRPRIKRPGGLRPTAHRRITPAASPRTAPTHPDAPSAMRRSRARTSGDPVDHPHAAQPPHHVCLAAVPLPQGRRVQAENLLKAWPQRALHLCGAGRCTRAPLAWGAWRAGAG